MSKKKDDPYTRGPSTRDVRSDGEGSVKRPSRRRTERRGIAGVPGSKNPERRCTATVRSTGEQCKRAAIKGGTVCTSHGGNAPQVQKKARERLADLVDPFIGELRRIVLESDADDSVKLRGIVALLDRTGYGPGQKIEIGVSKWDALFEDGGVLIDRDAIKAGDDSRALPPRGGGEPNWEDVDTFQSTARAEAWREYDDDDAREYEARPNFRTSDTVRGEAVVVEDSILPEQPDTRTDPSEFGGDPVAWPYERPPAS